MSRWYEVHVFATNQMTFSQFTDGSLLNLWRHVKPRNTSTGTATNPLAEKQWPTDLLHVQSLSKIVGTPTVSRYICLSTIIPSKNLTSPPPLPHSMLDLMFEYQWPTQICGRHDSTLNRGRGGRRFNNILVKTLMCPNTFESDCSCTSVLIVFTEYIICGFG